MTALALAGELCIWLAVLCAVAQCAMPWLITHAAHTPPRWRYCGAITAVHTGGVCAAWALLVIAFILSDFSLQLVVQHSHTAKPLLYKITGSWGNHEGSLLLWWMLLGLGGSVLYGMRRAYAPATARAALALHGALSAGLGWITWRTSNPFAPTQDIPLPTQGNGLNPLLQDIGLALHPPLLYLGYVGMALVYCVTIAALWKRDVSPAWADTTRTLARGSWGCMTLGLGLGAWWAYRELGWGGWWFWDPVENSALMPWLASTALLHSLILTHRRGQFAHWSVALSVLTFSLCILGTVLVRSGILTSVHGFAQDPERGQALLLYLLSVVALGMGAYRLRAHSLPETSHITLVSRTGGMLLQNWLLLTLCATVMAGTLYPIVWNWLSAQPLHIGPPYFNTLFQVLMPPALLLAGIAPWLGWQRTSGHALRSKLTHTLVITCVLGGVLYAWITPEHWVIAAGGMLTVWLGVATCVHMLPHLRRRDAYHPRRMRHWWGFTLGHLGLAVLCTGIVYASWGQHETQLRMHPGKSTTLAGYTFTYFADAYLREENYLTKRSSFLVAHGGKRFTLHPQYRFYPAAERYTSEAAMHSTVTKDIYVVTGETYATGEVAVRIYITPAMTWIWTGFVLMALAGCGSTVLHIVSTLSQRSKEPVDIPTK